MLKSPFGKRQPPQHQVTDFKQMSTLRFLRSLWVALDESPGLFSSAAFLKAPLGQLGEEAPLKR